MTCLLMCADCPDCSCPGCDETCSLDCHEIGDLAYQFACEDCRCQMIGRAPVSAALARRQHERCRQRGHIVTGGPVTPS